jgi:ATP-binding cassette subfamily B multidrug efflux pump
MWKLRRYLKNYRKEAVLAPLFKLLEASFDLMVPLVVKDIIDKGIAAGSNAYVISRGWLLVLLGVIGLCAAITAQYFSAKAAAGFGTALRDDLFAHILGLSSRETDALGQATLITRLTNDSMQMQTGMNMLFRLVLRSPFIVFGAMVMAFLIQGSKGLIFAGMIVLLFAAVFTIMSCTVRHYGRVQAKLDEVTELTGENLSGVRVIRAFCCEADEQKEYHGRTAALKAEQTLAGRISALMNPLTYVLVNLALVLILKTSAVDINLGTLSKGEAVALINYMSQILIELLKLADLIILLSKADACGKRISAVLETSSSMAYGSLDLNQEMDSHPSAPAVAFDHVSFAYPGSGSDVLRDVSFTVQPGETVGIIGGTGCGKSTLAALIARSYDADSGSVKIAGLPVAEYTKESLHRGIAEAAQVSRLFSGTIRSNLSWGDADADEQQMQEAVQAAQAADVIAQKKDHLDEPVLQQGKNFSGGQRQRLSLARAFMRRPKILIMDDSSSALDYVTDAALRRAVRQIRSCRAVFIISQRVSSVRHADHILVLDEGKVQGWGTHEQLVKDCPLYREICLSQLSEKEVLA